MKPQTARIVKLTSGVLVLLGAGYLGYYAYSTTENLDKTRAQMATDAQLYAEQIQSLQNQITDLTRENESVSSVLSDAQKKNLDLERAKRKNEKEIDTLTKLTTIDPELLKKYSKVFFLSDNYAPPKTEQVPDEFLINKDKKVQYLKDIKPFLVEMLEDARDDGMSLRVLSGYRSFSDQKSLKSAYVVTYGAGTANQFSAEQGYSEHQLGTTLDFTNPWIMGAELSFENSAEFAWMTQNAYKYGFALSYPKGNSYYMYEPWHWRFVGEELARDLHSDKKYFYEMDQRSIDEYLITLFDRR